MAKGRESEMVFPAPDLGRPDVGHYTGFEEKEWLTRIKTATTMAVDGWNPTQEDGGCSSSFSAGDSEVLQGEAGQEFS
ncbi:hypothetical protein CMUS01_05474 [Colletotrichum musicola]|uniref:Uncharacterized protein n=1 Tax=Colletotrichum musicola TaxID=2175873 RepID=A0A8H6NK41_9PEZI|nr:hypothetical protein CMUS01_05474 [Colletotrichum musicola]